MWSASSFHRWYLLAAGVAGAGIMAACASGATGAENLPSHGGTDSGENDGGGSGSSSGSTGGDDDSACAIGSSSGSTGSSSSGVATSSSSGAASSSGATDWVDLTGNANGCDNKPGTPCGYSATNNGLGWTCICYNGNFKEPWNCEGPNSCVIPGPACPASSAPVCSADAGSSGSSDSGTVEADGGGWVDMNNGATACDDKPGTPCGWAATNNGAGYKCTCYSTTQLDPWGCEPPGTASVCQ